MVNFLEFFNVQISSEYAKKNSLENKQLVTVKSGDIKYPGLVIISKKMKKECILCDNGCIPEQINKKKFTIEDEFHWLYAKSIKFKLIDTGSNTKNVSSINLKLQMDSTSPELASSNVESLSDFSNPESLTKFLKKELLQSFYIFLKTGMKVRLKYLTQKCLFIVQEIEPSFYVPCESFFKEIWYKCFEGTEVIIIDEEPTNIPSKSVLSFDNFGGYEKEINSIKEIVNKFFEGKSFENGIMVSGMSGTGKSFICNILKSVYANKCNLYTSEDINSSYAGETESNIKRIFHYAYSRGPSLVVMDNIDEICSKRDKDNTNVGIVNAFLHFIDGLKNSHRVLVVATATKPETLDQALRRPGRISHDIHLGLPSQQDRLRILQKLLQETPECIEKEELLLLIVSRTSGFVTSDLHNLISEAYSYTEDDFPSKDNFLKALEVVKPLSLKNVQTTSYKVSFEDVLQCSEIKKELQSIVEISLQHKNLFRSSNITIPTRLLIYGPSGCGKSMMIHALANHFNLPTIVCKRSNIFGKYFGESEKNLGLLFEQAEKSSPCILHFENFDGIAGKRSKDSDVSNEVEGRIINHLKVMLDGVQGFDNVFVIAETNRPDLLDKDVIRHGRFHKYLHVELPTDNDRKVILEHYLSTLTELEPNLVSSDMISDLITKSFGFSSGEIKLLCKELRSNLEERASLSETLTSFSYQEVLLSAIEDTLDAITPSNSSRMLKKYQEFSRIYCKHF